MVSEVVPVEFVHIETSLLWKFPCLNHIHPSLRW